MLQHLQLGSELEEAVWPPAFLVQIHFLGIISVKVLTLSWSLAFLDWPQKQLGLPYSVEVKIT